ncbi:MAG: hypothetical protein KR126chlam2_00910 [Chlamydiae bacterium]|nr:hypothetical protein [Chlamydiota bacterium]
MKKLFTALFFVQSALLFADEEVAEGGRDRSSFWQTLIMIGIAILFFYFILWRPEQRRRKQMEAKRGAMKTGDQVTAMGIVGTIDRIKEKTLIIKNVDGSKIEVVKGAVTEVKSSTEVLESK